MNHVQLVRGNSPESWDESMVCLPVAQQRQMFWLAIISCLLSEAEAPVAIAGCCYIQAVEPAETACMCEYTAVFEMSLMWFSSCICRSWMLHPRRVHVDNSTSEQIASGQLQNGS